MVAVRPARLRRAFPGVILSGGGASFGACHRLIFGTPSACSGEKETCSEAECGFYEGAQSTTRGPHQHLLSIKHRVPGSSPVRCHPQEHTGGSLRMLVRRLTIAILLIAASASATAV